MASSSVDNSARAERAVEWFAEAEKHIRVAKSLSGLRGLEPITIFHIQQAMEFVVKSLARASGYPHEVLKRAFGHNYVDLTRRDKPAFVEL